MEQAVSGTALHLVCELGKLKAATCLVESGIDLDCQEEVRFSLLSSCLLYIPMHIYQCIHVLYAILWNKTRFDLLALIVCCECGVD